MEVNKKSQFFAKLEIEKKKRIFASSFFALAFLSSTYNTQLGKRAINENPKIL